MRRLLIGRIPFFGFPALFEARKWFSELEELSSSSCGYGNGRGFTSTRLGSVCLLKLQKLGFPFGIFEARAIVKVLQSSSFPALRNLDLESTSPRPFGALGHLNSFLRRCNPPLDSVRLTITSVEENEALEFFSLTPALRKLEAHAPYGDWFTDRLVRALTLPAMIPHIERSYRPPTSSSEFPCLGLCSDLTNLRLSVDIKCSETALAGRKVEELVIRSWSPFSFDVRSLKNHPLVRPAVEAGLRLDLDLK